MKEHIALRNKIGSIPLDESNIADNLAIALATYFEEHPDKPKNAEVDDEIGWTKWAVQRTNEILDKIVAELCPKKPAT